MYAYAWAKDPIVNGFIAESGTSAMAETIGSKNPTAGWFKASQRAGCGAANTTTAEASLICMRNKPWKEIMKSTASQGSLAGLGGMGDYGPMRMSVIHFEYIRN